MSIGEKYPTFYLENAKIEFDKMMKTCDDKGEDYPPHLINSVKLCNEALNKMSGENPQNEGDA